jgi:ACS family hexuronate transporter-like MFS transporter
VTTATAVSAPPRSARLRWGVCALLFFATTINYIDRQVIGLLKPVLEKDLHWNEADYGWIVFGFQAAYAAMMPFAGRFLDRVGNRIGYLVSVGVWSLAATCNALAGSAAQFIAARFALGIGESGNFPAALRTVARWFPLRERSFATGIFNSGANIGALIAPLCVPWLALHYGWRSAFVVTGAAGFVWMFFWWLLYRDPERHPRITADALRFIGSGQPKEDSGRRLPFAVILRDGGAWACIAGKFLTDPIWWFFLYWLPGFLNRVYGLDLSSLGLPLVVIYQASTVGSIGGGWLAGLLNRRGWTPNASRKTAMLVCACAVVPLVFIPYTGGNLWAAVALISLAAAGHQGWSANILNLPSDVFPTGDVGTVVGLGTMGGAIGGMIVAPAVGYWLDFSHGAYGPLFVAAGLAYLAALGIVQILSPRLAPLTRT